MLRQRSNDSGKGAEEEEAIKGSRQAVVEGRLGGVAVPRKEMIHDSLAAADARGAVDK